MTKVLMKGSEAIAEAAIQAGCNYFFGYPITPQNEIPEYMSREMPKRDGTYVQSESEVASINMLLGAGTSGYQVMTSSSSPGISLMSEGLSYVAGSEIPVVVINVTRGGPGLGGILPSQADYFQATKGGGHGDYNLMVMAPSALQEAVDMVQTSWDYAFKYRIPIMILVDGFMGQMMEPVEIKPHTCDRGDWQKWAMGCYKERGNKRSKIHSLYLSAEALENHNRHLQAKYAKIRENEQKWESYMTDDADLIITAYGTTARIAKTAITHLRQEGYKVGLIRPIFVWPFPTKAFETLPSNLKGFLCVEMSNGQMVEDVKLAVNGRYPVSFYGRSGGFSPSVEEIEDQCKKLLG